MYYGASKLIRERAKELRLNLTAEEKMLWAYISNKQLGARFRRQHPIHTYIAESFVLNSNSLLKWMVESMRSMAWSYDGNNGNNYFGLFREWGLGVHRTTNTTGEDVIFPGEVMFGHPGEAYGLISDMYWSETVPFGFVWMTNGYHPGFNYAFGSSSSYYSVEEELFQDLKTLAFETCQTALGLEEVPSRATPFYWYAEPRTIIVKSEVSIKEIQLMDESGRVVHQSKPNAMECKIDTRALAPGIFVISVDTERGRFTQTISTFAQE